MSLRHAFAVLAAAVLLAPLPAAAQTVGTATGSIIGSARDASGAVLPNVHITVSGARIMGVRTTTTTTDGVYRVVALPPGEYRLSFALNGFTPAEHMVTVALGFSTTLDVVLSIAGQREQVTVAARASVLDRRATAITTTFDAHQLAALPGSRNMSAPLTIAPAVTVDTTSVGGGAGDVGARGAYGTTGGPRPTVEGIVVMGIFGSGVMLDYGAFQEVSVLTGAHGPEWPTHGVHLQLLTKSGSNQYRGTLHASYENRRWQSTNVDQDQIDRGARTGDANRLWRYRDLNADAGGFVVRDRLWWYASLRDQDVASRLVNFPVRPHETRLTNYSGKVNYRLAPGSTLVAYGQKGSNRQPNGLESFAVLSTTAIHESEASTANQHNDAWVWKAEWNAALSDRLQLEMRLGQFGTREDLQPRSAAPRFEDAGTLIVSGGNRQSSDSLRRDQLFGSVSYFKDRWLGSHVLKAGMETMRWHTASIWQSGFPGNILHTLQNGRANQVYFFHTPSHSESGLWTYAAYASDSWQVGSRLTLNLGVRFDRYRVFLPAQQHPADRPDGQRFAAVDNLIDWNVVVPRLGAVYDLTGDGRTLAKLVYAKYRSQPGLMVGSNSNPNAPVWWTRYAWTDQNGSGSWEPGEQGPERGRRGGDRIESLDPALRLPVMNEAGAWIERELPAGAGVRAGVVWRGERQQYMRQNANQPFDAFTVALPLRDPGPDGVPDTADDGSTLTAYDLAPGFAQLPAANILRNVPGVRSGHWTWEITASRRAQGGWSFGGGFAQTWSREHAASYSGQGVRNNTYPLTPNDLLNTGPGGRHEFTTWNAKAFGSYEAPWQVRVSPVLRHQSGQPYGRTFSATAPGYGTFVVLAEPVGTRRMANITVFDVRVEKRFRLARARRLSAFVDVFNVFNANPEEELVWSSGSSFSRPLRIVPPRIAALGAKLDW